MPDRPLSKGQTRLLQSAVSAYDEEPARVHRARQKTYAQVRRALNRGVPATVLAHHLGLTRARIYQMRDEADAYDATSKASTVRSDG